MFKSLLLALFLFFLTTSSVEAKGWWEFQSIDTMKHSRDLARAKLGDTSFDQTIDLHISSIANTGATHVGIGTPYDEEFVPFLKRWVVAAREYNLKVWFRGNWSGWEGWFEYDKISREEHLEKTRQFILNNSDLFEEGDIFTSCPECENGGPGDPRKTRDIEGHRLFLISEFDAMNKAFGEINKNVTSGYFSMNGDVANLIMDRQTTSSLGGVVVLDHYVESPDTLAFDIADIAHRSGGKVILGEFGAPVPDIHGSLTEEEQAQWLDSALAALAPLEGLIGVNYWVGFGGSTHLWTDDGKARQAQGVLQSVYSPRMLYGYIKNEVGLPITNVEIAFSGRVFASESQGKIRVPYFALGGPLEVSSQGYEKHTILTTKSDDLGTILLIKSHPGFIFRMIRFIYLLLRPDRLVFDK